MSGLLLTDEPGNTALPDCGQPTKLVVCSLNWRLLAGLEHSDGHLYAVANESPCEEP